MSSFRKFYGRHHDLVNRYKIWPRRRNCILISYAKQSHYLLNLLSGIYNLLFQLQQSEKISLLPLQKITYFRELGHIILLSQWDV
jgi:hypothetical protein